MKKLKHVNETYFKHLLEATLIFFVAITAGIICLIHGLLPFMFEKTASSMLKWIMNRHLNRLDTYC